MTKAMIAGGAGLAAIVLAVPFVQSLANAPPVAVTAEEIAQAVRGKICSTRMGATFTFGLFGDYAYDGLWKSGGGYVIGDGIITVTLDNGLERSFAITRHGDVLFIEQTALFCPSSEPAV